MKRRGGTARDDPTPRTPDGGAGDRGAARPRGRGRGPAGAADPRAGRGPARASATSCATSSCAAAPSSTTTASAWSATGSRPGWTRRPRSSRGWCPPSTTSTARWTRRGGRRRCARAWSSPAASCSPSWSPRASIVDDPRGEPFDPERHQALSHEPVARASPTARWSRCSARATRYKDRLLRPALVKVAKGARRSGGDRGAVH